MVCDADHWNCPWRNFYCIFGLEVGLGRRHRQLSALCMVLLRVIEPPLPEHPKSTKGMSAYGEGLRFMIQRPAIWTMATVKVGWNCVGAVTLMLTILWRATIHHC